jgi:hypothetical protein
MSTAGLTEELRLVEEDLTRLQKTAADLRRRIGDPKTSRPTPRSGRR